MSQGAPYLLNLSLTESELIPMTHPQVPVMIAPWFLGLPDSFTASGLCENAPSHGNSFPMEPQWYFQSSLQESPSLWRLSGIPWSSERMDHFLGVVLRLAFVSLRVCPCVQTRRAFSQVDQTPHITVILSHYDQPATVWIRHARISDA